MEIKRAIKILDCIAAQTTPLPLGDDGIKAVEMAIEALKKQASIERALEQLEERKKNSLKSCETMSDSIIYRDAIEIIKDEVE